MKKKGLFHSNLFDLMTMYKIIFTYLFFLTISSFLYADQNDKRLNYLFDKLVVAEEEKEINKITNQIWKIWHEIDDPKTTREFETGVQMMNLGYFKRSIDYFDKVINKNQNFAEAWNKRATAHFMMGNFDLSMQDISKTLQLEPRHFGALDGMGLIYIHLNQPDKAIDIYNKMLEIFPNSISTKMKIERILSRKTQST
ncbi:tetratricopeptide repeat protein [Pelagibacterales bacterium SAG-MED31]|nr:tetratricopeptide repeat protein [Pelagibacterales bacterium SAG-MED31]